MVSNPSFWVAASLSRPPASSFEPDSPVPAGPRSTMPTTRGASTGKISGSPSSDSASASASHRWGSPRSTSCTATCRSPARSSKPTLPRSAASTKAGAASSVADSTVTSPSRPPMAPASEVLKRRRTTLARGASSCNSRAMCRLARSASPSRPHTDAPSTPASLSVSSCSGSLTTSGIPAARAARANGASSWAQTAVVVTPSSHSS